MTMNCPNRRFHLLPTFAKTRPLFLLVFAFSLCALHAAPLSIFDLDYKWRFARENASKAEGSITQDTVDNSNAIILNYDFSKVEESSSVGIAADKNVLIEEGNGPVRFRVKASTPFVSYFVIRDSNAMAHLFKINHEPVEGWSEIEVPLDYDAFSAHHGRGTDPGLEKTIAFPIISVEIHINYKPDSEGIVPTGTITFAGF